MRFLPGECLPPWLAGLLRAAGHDCAHVYELGPGGQPDEQIMNLADRENQILNLRRHRLRRTPRQRARASTERHPAPPR